MGPEAASAGEGMLVAMTAGMTARTMEARMVFMAFPFKDSGRNASSGVALKKTEYSALGGGSYLIGSRAIAAIAASDWIPDYRRSCDIRDDARG
jgi:hypothetical protein